MLTTAVSIFVLMGMLGLSVDLGRVYIAKNEAQAFADLAAVGAASHLNGKQSGIDAAKTDVTTSTNNNTWNFSTTKFGSTSSGGNSPAPIVEFSTSATGTWDPAPSGSLKSYSFVRVTVTPRVNLAFLPAVGTALTQQVTGRAVAGVVPQTFPNGGYLPFTPFAHNPTLNADGTPQDPDFGYTIGQEYAILWPGKAKQADACAGDAVNWPQYNYSDNPTVGSGSDRGYFELQSAADIADAILGGKQTDPLKVGDSVLLTGGQKTKEQNALELRATYDTDPTVYLPTPGTAPAYYGNNMRLVILPINDVNNVNGEVKIIGFRAFLLPMTYPNNKAWCAIYMGSMTQGGTGGGTPGDPGAYVVRLVQ
jgi:Flp pilus assembly protein TadG